MNFERSLSDRTRTAVGWRFAAATLKFVLQMAVTVVLARLLPVESFGIIAQASIVIGFVTVVSEAGMAPTLIQRRTLGEEHIRVAFSISLVMGILLCGSVWVLAPLGGSFFRSPETVPVLRLLGASFLFASIGATVGALLQRQLDFRRLFWTDVLSYVGGYAVIGILLAACGFGVWALAWACLLQTFLKTCLTVGLAGRPVRLGFGLREAKGLFASGSGMSATRLVLHAARNLDYLVVGRFLGAEALGLYTRAYQLMVLPIFHFSGVLNAVLFPAYAEIQDQQERLRRVFLSNIRVVAIIVFPLLAGMAVVAPELVAVLFGSRWSAMTPILQVLCIGGVFLTIHNLGDSLACAKGAIRQRFQRHLVYAFAVWGMTFYGIQWGPMGAAAGVVLALVLQYLLMAQLCLRLVGSGWRDFWSAQGLGVALASLVALTAQSTALGMRWLDAAHWTVLAASVTSSAVVSILVAFRVPRVWLPSLFHVGMNRLESHLRMLVSGRHRNIPELEKGVS